MRIAYSAAAPSLELSILSRVINIISSYQYLESSYQYLESSYQYLELSYQYLELSYEYYLELSIFETIYTSVHTRSNALVQSRQPRRLSVLRWGAGVSLRNAVSAASQPPPPVQK